MSDVYNETNIGKLLLIITPPQFEKFFEEIGIPVDDKLLFQPSPIIPALIENVIETAANYEIIT